MNIFLNHQKLNYSKKIFATIFTVFFTVNFVFPLNNIATNASYVEPALVQDNPTCEDLGYESEFKVDPPNNGAYSVGTIGTVTVANINDGQFDWTSTFGIDAVVAKGGPNANLYVYDPPTESFNDTSLVTPTNPNNDEPYGLSHILFCYDADPTYTIAGKKFNDENCDGERSCGEDYLSDWEITIEGPNQLSDSTFTAFGLYYFSDLYPGVYTVCETQQNGWEQTYPEDNNGCHIIEITDSNITGVDFGNHFGSCEVECTTDLDCDDGLWCNGAEICNLDTNECQAGTPVDCDDGVGCTDDI